MLHEDRTRATSFGANPELYHHTRPSYPAGLVDALLADGARDVLDVGCGTGLVSRLFRDHGCQVLGVEVDDRMAEYARQQEGLEVETARFEEWDSAGRSFDLVVSGQAWHWVDPYAGALKAAEVLRSGGRIGLFWNRAIHPAPVKEAFDRVYSEIAPDLDRYSIVLGRGTADRFDAGTAGLEAAGSFEAVVRQAFPWEATYTTAKWLDHLVTHSDHQALDPATRDRLLAAVGGVIDGLGGSFTTTYEAVLLTAPRH